MIQMIHKSVIKIVKHEKLQFNRILAIQRASVWVYRLNFIVRNMQKWTMVGFVYWLEISMFVIVWKSGTNDSGE